MLTETLEVLVAILWAFYYMLEKLVKLCLPDSYLNKDISGQVLLVTGGGSGIGRLMCLKFARLGAIVVTWDINQAGNEETVNMIKAERNRAVAFTVDMSKKEEIYDAARKTKSQVGPVTILLNNAGIVSGDTILNTPDSRIIKTFEVNTLSHFWTVKAFLPDMLAAKQGHIVTVASMAGHAGTNKLVDYCASKFGAVGFDESLRVELFVQGHASYIKTTAACPYYISTGMFAGVQSKIIPILEPDFVAQSIVEATLQNKEIILLPWWASLLTLLKALVPAPAFMKLAQAFGFNCSMDQFQGREKDD